MIVYQPGRLRIVGEQAGCETFERPGAGPPGRQRTMQP